MNDNLLTFWTETVAQVLPCSPAHPLQNSRYLTLVLVLPCMAISAAPYAIETVSQSKHAPRSP